MLPSRRRNDRAAVTTQATAEPDSTLTKAVVAAGPSTLMGELSLQTSISLSFDNGDTDRTVSMRRTGGKPCSFGV